MDMYYKTTILHMNMSLIKVFIKGFHQNKGGDFALSTLVAIKDDIEALYGIVERMIAVGISCLAIKNIYFNYIPDNVIRLADKNHFPIMIFSDTFTEKEYDIGVSALHESLTNLNDSIQESLYACNKK